MDWLNYHHLYYFWVVAREGSIARACELLELAQPTISHQIHELEQDLGHKLFTRAGRGIQLTEQGQVVYRYAQDIFALGRELQQAVKGLGRQRALQFRVGVAGFLPTLLVQRLLAPAWDFAEPIQVLCHADRAEPLLADMAVHQMDLVLADAPPRPAVRVRAYPHLLGESGVSFLGTPDLAARYRPGFPQSLHEAPLLVPPEQSPLRRALDRWLAAQEVHPFLRAIVAECAALEAFGQAGRGIFVVPTSIEADAVQRWGVEVIGQTEAVRSRWYAISADRKLKHPVANLLVRAARERVFAEPPVVAAAPETVA